MYHFGALWKFWTKDSGSDLSPSPSRIVWFCPSTSIHRLPRRASKKSSNWPRRTRRSWEEFPSFWVTGLWFVDQQHLTEFEKLVTWTECKGKLESVRVVVLWLRTIVLLNVFKHLNFGEVLSRHPNNAAITTPQKMGLFQKNRSEMFRGEYFEGSPQGLADKLAVAVDQGANAVTYWHYVDRDYTQTAAGSGFHKFWIPTFSSFFLKSPTSATWNKRCFFPKAQEGWFIYPPDVAAVAPLIIGDGLINTEAWDLYKPTVADGTFWGAFITGTEKNRWWWIGGCTGFSPPLISKLCKLGVVNGCSSTGCRRASHAVCLYFHDTWWSPRKGGYATPTKWYEHELFKLFFFGRCEKTLARSILNMF